MTHVCVKKLKEALQALVRAVQDQFGVPRAIEGMKEARLINVLVQEGEESSSSPSQGGSSWVCSPKP
mgnify:CR=1 FL=1